MKVFKEIGSKDRFIDMFQKVNKIKLHEALGVNLNPKNVLETAFNDLKSKRLKIESSNTQVTGDSNFVELVCIDKQGNNIVFTFSIESKESDQEGVFEIGDAKLTAFSYDDASSGESVEMDESGMKFFNEEHKDEIVNIVDEYADVEEEEPVDTLYEEAIKKIDSYPVNIDQYSAKKKSEFPDGKMQTGKAYADEKPTNPDLRVSAEELEKYVNEEEFWNDFDTERSALSQYNTGRSVEIAPPADKNIEDNGEGEETSEPEELSQEKIDIIYQAYESILKEKGNPNYAPTSTEIRVKANEIAKEKGIKANFEEELKPDAVKILNKGVENVFDTMKSESEIKKAIILKAKQIVDEQGDWDIKKFKQPEEYKRKIKNVAMYIYVDYVSKANIGAGMNENDYPEQLGKEFSPDASDYPGKKKKHKTKKIKIKEDEEEKPEAEPETDDGMSLEPEGDEIEQIAQNKEEVGELIPGGKGEGKSPLEFDPEQIKLGMKVEMEHTEDPMIALEISLDHLTEDPEYYTVKDTPEASAQAGASKDAVEGGEEDEKEEKSDDDEEMTDVLLGYEPKNVGDEIESDEEGETQEKAEHEEAPENAQISVDPNLDATPESKPFKNKEDELGESEESELKDRDPATWHQIQIAKKTVRMPGAMANVMGGMTKEEAKEILRKRGIKFEEEDEQYDFATTEKQYTDKDAYEKYQKYLQMNLSTLTDEQKEEFFELWKEFRDKPDLKEEVGFEEYKGNVGDKYADAEGNEFVVSNKVKGGVSLKGQRGEKEIATKDLQFMKKLNEENERINNIITEEQIKTAKLTLSNRNIPTGMTKKEAVQILMNNNLKKIL
jgi:hypothetical protein